MLAASFTIGCFLLGSIPFGYLIARFFFNTDIRKSGSGNIGAANAMRTIGTAGGVAVLVLDALKGFAPVFLGAHALVIDAWTIAAGGAAAVLGHCFSPWLGWKGGKGVATSIGVIYALSWQAGLACTAAFMAGGFATAYSSVGSMLANLVAPAALWFFTGVIPYIWYGVFTAAFIVYTHRENLARLRGGTENRTSLFRPGKG